MPRILLPSVEKDLWCPAEERSIAKPYVLLYYIAVFPLLALFFELSGAKGEEIVLFWT